MTSWIRLKTPPPNEYNVKKKNGMQAASNFC